MSFLHTAENLIHWATDVVEIAEMLGGHPISPLGTIVHGTSALAHLGAGYLADDQKSAHHHFAEAANGVEAIPLLGTGISIANLASQTWGSPSPARRWTACPSSSRTGCSATATSSMTCRAPCRGYKELHTPAAIPQAAPARDYTWAEQVENHKKGPRTAADSRPSR